MFCQRVTKEEKKNHNHNNIKGYSVKKKSTTGGPGLNAR